MKRIVQPELLDSLSPADPRAIRSRRDLRRVNSLMRNQVILAEAIKKTLNRRIPSRITDLGAGDGNFFLGVAQLIRSRLPGVNVTLIDRQNIVSAETLHAFLSLGWRAEVVVADVFTGLQNPSEGVVTNLFLHHFDETRLTELLRLISLKTKWFIALEPRRGLWPQFWSRMLWAVGCNDVTRHDATVSVRAGFSGKELSALWPDHRNWQLTERRVGLFSHLFIARKIS